MRPELGLSDTLDEEIEHAADTGLRFDAWPEPIKALWRKEKFDRRRRELAFINGIGLAWCIVCLALDYTAGPEVFSAGLALRLGLVAPLYLLAIWAAFFGGWHAQRWTTIAAVPAFAGVAGYLGMHVATVQMQEYVMAAGMLLAMAIVVLPLRVPWLAVMAAVSVAILWGIWATMPGRGEAEFTLLCFISGTAFASLILPLRTARLKDQNFLFALRARIVSRRLMAANEQLRALSDRDDLTGLPNRRYLERVFDDAFRASVRDGHDLAVIMIDVDHFKAFNDTHGHVAGDRALTSVARTLEQTLAGPGQMIARYGGEEFIAIVEGANEETVLRLADRARQAVEDRPVATRSRKRVTVTVSMGVSLRREVDLSPTAIIERADAALYEAKRAGRNLVRLAGRKNGKPPAPVVPESA